MRDELSCIYKYRKLSDLVLTAGQPSIEELYMVADRGCDLVVNLAMHDADYSLSDEQAVVESRGMQYEHIPVLWESPMQADFARFSTLMKQQAGQIYFIHCAANIRVSIFLAMYFSLCESPEKRWSKNVAMNYIEEIWQPNECWAGFITLLQDNSKTGNLL